MMTLSSKTLVVAAALAALTTSALADAATPTPWVLAPDMGYGYGKDGKTFSYKMGTNNAGLLLKALFDHLNEQLSSRLLDELHY